MDDDFEPEEQTPEGFLRVAILMELGLGLVALVLGVIFGPDPRELVPDWFDYLGLGSGLLWGVLAAVPMVLAVQLLEKLPLKAIRDLQKVTEERVIGLMLHLRNSELAIVSMCAGVGEEMLFRGWLFMGLAGAVTDWDTSSLAIAVVFSSVAFGLAHPISPAYIVVTGLMGIYFAMLLIWSENLLVPIVAHAVYDFVELVLATRAMRQEAKAT
ncbi:CPBP family intramembrane glutamic endopeptidase [Planctomycetaceae bacterium SH139]